MNSIYADYLVAVVAIVLGVGALASSISGGRLVSWSPAARAISERFGKLCLILVTLSLGLFLIGVGLSIIFS